ncbi:MAG: PIG-L family deacetylase [Lentisphaerae bacterium]|nr:PIG-L family deacetylase [Lentisphaerota bacterium]
MKILAIGAHPDDIEYGCGGLLIRGADAGHEIFLHVLTDGSATTDADRKTEQSTAAEMLGAKELFWGGFKDTGLVQNRELIVALENIIKKVNPDVVLVNAPGDAHQDHEALANCAVTACRYQKRVLFYHDYTTLNFQPDTFIDIGDVLDRKRALLACHASQVNKQNPTGLDLLESVGALAAYYGFMAKVRYAEAFRPLRNLIEPI